MHQRRFAIGKPLLPWNSLKLLTNFILLLGNIIIPTCLLFIFLNLQCCALFYVCLLLLKQYIHCWPILSFFCLIEILMPLILQFFLFSKQRIYWSPWIWLARNWMRRMYKWRIQQLLSSQKLSFLMLKLKFIHEWMHFTSYLMGKLHTVEYWLFHNF